MSITSNPLDPAIMKSTTTSPQNETNSDPKTNKPLDISNNITSVIEDANTVRLRYIIDFISQLESDFRKYSALLAH